MRPHNALASKEVVLAFVQVHGPTQPPRRPIHPPQKLCYHLLHLHTARSWVTVLDTTAALLCLQHLPIKGEALGTQGDLAAQLVSALLLSGVVMCAIGAALSEQASQA